MMNPKPLCIYWIIRRNSVTEYGIAQIEAGAHLPLLFEPAGIRCSNPTKVFH